VKSEKMARKTEKWHLVGSTYTTSHIVHRVAGNIMVKLCTCYAIEHFTSSCLSGRATK